MRKLLTSIFEKLADKFREKEQKVTAIEEKKDTNESRPKCNKISKKSPPKNRSEVIPYKENPARDLMEMMEVPFLALSKNRKNPILYESSDGTRKVKVTRHTGHFLASIYDWDIILFVARKMQEILNNGSDIPPRTLIVPRHEILKAIHKHNGKKEEKDLKSSLTRLKLTGIETTIRNEDSRYEAGFGFLDSWKYTDRKDIKEISITLSQWLYDGICAQGALLKVDPAYFELTSALKRFLYRTARKHVGKSNESWEFSIDKLYEKSGSEREIRKFKSDLKAVVMENDIPGYTMRWAQRTRRDFVVFSRSNTIEKIDHILESVEQNLEKKNNEHKGGDITDMDKHVHKIH